MSSTRKGMVCIHGEYKSQCAMCADARPDEAAKSPPVVIVCRRCRLPWRSPHRCVNNALARQWSDAELATTGAIAKWIGSLAGISRINPLTLADAIRKGEWKREK